jgi:GTP pyrophosphokinase
MNRKHDGPGVPDAAPARKGTDADCAGQESPASAAKPAGGAEPAPVPAGAKRTCEPCFGAPGPAGRRAHAPAKGFPYSRPPRPDPNGLPGQETPGSSRGNGPDGREPLPGAPTLAPKAIGINTVIDAFLDVRPDADDESAELIRGAYTLAAVAHSGAFRLSGEPYLTHPLAVAYILACMKLDAVTIAAGLLHDTVEDTPVTLEEIRENFGPEFGPQLAGLVDGVTKLPKEGFDGPAARRAANMEKLVLASAADLRTLLVKLADRLHNMRTLGFMDAGKRREIARETLDYFAPFAARLGARKIKAELEDLSLSHFRPADYEDVAARLADARGSLGPRVMDAAKLLAGALSESGTDAEVTVRNKSVYGAWRKARLQGVPFGRIRGLFSFRVAVSGGSADSCRRALSTARELFRPLPARFKDRVAAPKPGRRRSLRTAVEGPDGARVEIRILAAGTQPPSGDGAAAPQRRSAVGGAPPRRARTARRFLNALARSLEARACKSPEKRLDFLRKSLAPGGSVFVFTPEDGVVKLPRGATPIDFAYRFGQGTGDRLSEAFVDGRPAGLGCPLPSLSAVRVVTDDTASPAKLWLKMAASPETKAMIRRALAAAPAGPARPPRSPARRAAKGGPR